MKRIVQFVQFVLLVVALVCVQFGAPVAAAGERKAVLITGASTGIGRNMAERLAREGYFVYAGARKDKDLAELDAIENIKGVRLDVTKQDDVDAAVAFVVDEGLGLYGLVNNAGVATRGTVAEVQDEEIDFLYEVNIKGVFRVTRAFLPLIVESRGRIVTTGSIAGLRSGPAGSVYSMSKHAVEAFTDSLAVELAASGVQVSVIEPGSYKSHIRRNAVARMTGSVEAAGGEMTDEMRALAKRMVEQEMELDEPDDVTAALIHALSAETAHRRYLVTPTNEQAEQVVRAFIQRVAQVNQWEQRQLTRDELVAMLDEALEAQGASD